MDIYYLEQFLFFSSLLSGFSFAIVAQLISMASEKKIMPWAIGCFSTAASMFLASTFGTFLILIQEYTWKGTMTNEIQMELYALWCSIFYMFYISIPIFLIGGGTLGWIRSRNTGFITTTASIVSAIVMFYVFFSINDLHP